MQAYEKFRRIIKYHKDLIKQSEELVTKHQVRFISSGQKCKNLILRHGSLIHGNTLN